MTDSHALPAPAGEKVGPFQVVILLLSVYVLVAMFVELTVALPPRQAQLLRIIDDAICVIFLADFFIRLARAKSKLAFLKWGWIDFISSIPALPFLRWGRLIRIVRIFRVLRAIRSAKVVFGFLYRNRAQGTFATVALIAIAVAIFASLAILEVEHVPNGNIKSPDDALWWSIVTMTTVGYGDRYPVTVGGRIIAILLMGAGISLFGTFSALLASFFIEPEQKEESAELKVLIEEVRSLRAQVDRLQGGVQAAQ